MKKVNFKDGFTRVKIVWVIFFLILGIFTIYFPLSSNSPYFPSCWINIFGPFFGNNLIACDTSISTEMSGVAYLLIALIPVFFYDITGFVDLLKRIYMWVSIFIIYVFFSLYRSEQQYGYLYVCLGIVVFGFILFKTLDFIKDGFLKK
jgi:hypothetical protein